MTALPGNAPVALRITQNWASLSQSHQDVARYVMAYPLQVAALPIDEMAEAAGVSVATANRFARALGYDGYAQFRAALVLGFEALIAPVEKLRGEMERPSTIPDVFASALGEIGRNIETTRRLLDAESCEAAVKAILAARRTSVLGLGSSAWLAGLLVRDLDIHCPDVRALTTQEGPSSGARALRRMGEGDLLIAIATPRYFADTILLAKRARDRGATVLALTDGPHSPLAPHAHLALHVHVESRYFASSDSSMLALIEALASAVAHFSGAPVEAARELTEAVLPWLDASAPDTTSRSAPPAPKALAPRQPEPEPEPELRSPAKDIA